MLENFEITQLKGFTDGRGVLVSLEELGNIPFEIQRTYFLTDLKPQLPRGFHAHKQLKQFAVCLAGSCRMILDDGKSKKEFTLNEPTKGVFIDRMIWHEMHDFSADCVFMVLANDFYDEGDYIREYSQFLKEVHDSQVK